MEKAELVFSHGHLAGQAGMAFAVDVPADEDKKGNGNGGVHFITGGADCNVCLRSSESGFTQTETEINEHEEAITCVATNGIKSKRKDCKTDMFATGSEDRFVKLYSYPDAVFETNATRFELPVRAIDFAPNGQLLACGGDDEGIRVVRIETDGNGGKRCKVVRTLRTAGRSIKSIKWDPEGVYVAAVSADGTLQVWKFNTGETVLTRRSCTHRFDASGPQCGHVCWHPEGIFLAIPTSAGDIDFIERLSWNEDFSLPAHVEGEDLGHKGPGTCVVLSPNGLYAATAGLDRRVVVWDTSKRQPVSHTSSDAVVCNMQWHPFENKLSLIDEEGNFAVWDSPVPDDLVKPFEFGDEEEEDLREKSGGEAAADAKGGAKATMGRLQQKRASAIQSDSEDDDLDDDGDDENGGDGHDNPAALRGPGNGSPVRLHKCIQPGSTPWVGHNSRRFLAYNMLGYISTMKGNDYRTVEVAFHDISKRSSRIPTLTDYFGFELGALGSKGTVLASPERSEKAPSVLMYRPFESWAANSEWTCTFPVGEQVTSVAVGSTFVAAATEKRHLRVYSLAGNLQAVISVPGARVIALAGEGNTLAVVFQEHRECGQSLRFCMYDVASETKVSEGPVPLSASVSGTLTGLEWAGFSEQGTFITCDTTGCVRGYFSSYGGSWFPMFDSKDQRKAETEHHYVVGISQKELCCIITKSDKNFPQVIPRPIITTLPLRIPVVSADTASKPLQEDYLLTKLHHSQFQLASNVDSSAMVPMEIEMDKTLLKLIQAAIKSDHLDKAFDLTSVLNLQRSLHGALKLANVMRKSVLAEKITTLIQNREALAQVASRMATSNGYDDPNSLSLQTPSQTNPNTFSSVEPGAKHMSPFAREHNHGDANRKRVAAGDPVSPAPKNPFARRN